MNNPTLVKSRRLTVNPHSLTAPELEKTINEDIGDAKNIILDVKGMEYISSAGLRVLLGAQKKMQKIGSMRVT